MSYRRIVLLKGKKTGIEGLIYQTSVLILLAVTILRMLLTPSTNQMKTMTISRMKTPSSKMKQLVKMIWMLRWRIMGKRRRVIAKQLGYKIDTHIGLKLRLKATCYQPSIDWLSPT